MKECRCRLSEVRASLTDLPRGVVGKWRRKLHTLHYQNNQSRYTMASSHQCCRQWLKRANILFSCQEIRECASSSGRCSVNQEEITGINSEVYIKTPLSVPIRILLTTFDIQLHRLTLIPSIGSSLKKRMLAVLQKPRISTLGTRLDKRHRAG